MERKNLMLIVAALMIVLLLTAGVYWFSIQSASKEPEPTSTVTSTPLPTQPTTSTLEPEPAVSFTLWHSPTEKFGNITDRLAQIPPVLEIVYPQNNTVIQTNQMTMNVNVASYFWIINSVYYQTDWLEGTHQIFGIQPSSMDSMNASITVNFRDIPDGNHTIIVYAVSHDGSQTDATIYFTNRGI